MTEALNQTIVAAIIGTIRRTLFLPEFPISLETRLTEDLSLDSLETVELLIAIEETFQTRFPSDASLLFRDVSEIVTYLSRRYFRDAVEEQLCTAT
jgi:acyl carrier protein